MGITARLDGFQRRHTWLGFPLAVVYKFVDDQGGYLAVLITYYGFVSLFPGLLLLISVLGYTLQSHPAWQQEVLGSALQQFPIVGPQLQQNVSSIHGVSIQLRLSSASCLRSFQSSGTAVLARIKPYMPWRSRSASSTAELIRTVYISACGTCTDSTRLAASHTGLA